MSTTWITFHFFLSLIQSQRVTLFSWPLEDNIDGWSIFGTDSYISSFSNCPAAPITCYRMSNDNELYIFIDTIGYIDIQISYDIRTKNLNPVNEECGFWYTLTSTTNGGDGWDEYDWHIANNAPESVLHSLPNDVNNVAHFGISFWANMGSGAYCFLNNVEITGIAITTTPTSTSNPTRKPTLNPTSIPSTQPTSRPTDPAASTCGDNVIGSYHGDPVTFLVHIPFQGDLEFNAAQSSFTVTDIQALTKLNIPLDTDADHDEAVTLTNIPSGDYKFIINGTTSGTFEARIRCYSDTPTASPSAPSSQSLSTQNPSYPTEQPLEITSDPTNAPTSNPAITTSHPTQAAPEAVACDEVKAGVYHANTQLTFETTIPFAGELIFDARSSDFNITVIESYTGAGKLLGADRNHDEMITMMVPAGDYTFIMIGTVQTTGIYYVRISCVSGAPTIAPTPQPTAYPFVIQSVAPTASSDAVKPSDDDIISSTVATNKVAEETTSEIKRESPGSVFWNDRQTAVIGIVLLSVLAVCCLCLCVLLSYCGFVRRKEDEDAVHEMVNLNNKPQQAANIIPTAGDTEYERALVRSWIQKKVQLPQYMDAFIQHGYDCMRAIEAITDKEELDAIGIKAVGHQVLIMSEIKKLNELSISKSLPLSRSSISSILKRKWMKKQLYAIDEEEPGLIHEDSDSSNDGGNEDNVSEPDADLIPINTELIGHISLDKMKTVEGE